jgi:hypothetical protein
LTFYKLHLTPPHSQKMIPSMTPIDALRITDPFHLLRYAVGPTVTLTRGYSGATPIPLSLAQDVVFRDRFDGAEVLTLPNFDGLPRDDPVAVADAEALLTERMAARIREYCLANRVNTVRVTFAALVLTESLKTPERYQIHSLMKLP